MDGWMDGWMDGCIMFVTGVVNMTCNYEWMNDMNGNCGFK